MTPKRSRKIKAQRVEPSIRRGKEIGVPVEQLLPGSFTEVDVANRSDGDQRHSVRSGETETIRRKSRIERLLAAKVIEPHHQRALEWYACQHEEGLLRGLNVTANLGGAGGGTYTAYDLCAKSRDQAEARANYFWARSAIPHDLVAHFEAVVIGHADLNTFPSVGNSERTRFRNRRAAFLLACNRLHTAVQHITG